MNADINVHVGDSKDTALHKNLLILRWFDTCEKARFLLENGANINAKNVYGDTPLYRAIRFGVKGLAHIMAGHGAEMEDAIFRMYETTWSKWGAQGELLKILQAAKLNCYGGIVGLQDPRNVLRKAQE